MRLADTDAQAYASLSTMLWERLARPCEALPYEIS